MTLSCHIHLRALLLPLCLLVAATTASGYNRHSLPLCGADTLAAEPEWVHDSVSVDTVATPDSLTLSQAAELADAAQAAAKRLRTATFQPDPTRALWLALVLPGGGQIYNRKYWKLPIVYGGYLGCFYALSWNNQMLRDYSQAYLDIMDDDPDTKSYEKMLPLGYNIAGRETQFQTIFKNKKNYYRRYRDMSIFAFFAVYAISVIDAYVDAELSSFDITPDLSLHVAPTVITTKSRTSVTSRPSTSVGTPPESALGMAFRLSF